MKWKKGVVGSISIKWGLCAIYSTGYSICFLLPVLIVQHIGSWGISGAFDLEADSLPVGLADILVGNSSRCASTFERGRVGKMFGLCRCPFCISQGPVYTNACDIRCRIHLSDRNRFSPSNG